MQAEAARFVCRGLGVWIDDGVDAAESQQEGEVDDDIFEESDGAGVSEFDVGVKSVDFFKQFDYFGAAAVEMKD